MLRIERVLLMEGRRKGWLARRLGVSGAQVTRMLNGERRWIEEAKGRAAEALGWTGAKAATLFEPVELGECPACGGTGTVEAGMINGRVRVVLCDLCGGTGEVEMGRVTMEEPQREEGEKVAG